MDAASPAASAAAWPDQLLDVAAVRAGGRRPTPFRDFVLKVHQRCNLACDYCYVYTKADQSWRTRPVAMPDAVVDAAAARISAHVQRHRLDEVQVVLHGGEPLLAGWQRLVSLAGRVRRALPASTAVRVYVQTNGLLLDEASLDGLLEAEIHVGVSLDGARADNDRHRRHVNGHSSYSALHQALTLLSATPYRSVFAGLLCTVDPRADPVACFDGLLRYAPPAVDFLLPHANWSSPPVGSGYGRWLATAFDRWYSPGPPPTQVRLFEEVVHLLLGGASRTEQVGLSPAAVVVVESDGAIEQSDALKSAYAGATATGLNVMTDGFDAALEHPGVVARQIGLAALSATCLQCPVHEVCGAGHYAHRYRAGAGFRNPSVYCADLRLFIDHVRHRVTSDLAALAHRTDR
ncbi:MAG TPA: FxsB family cyclophane-forming radical SAM/SPASM peptide maturase [Micromonosporaceae bacterium]|nr:FxsB family cyclophane-forming radical SAM/SPASM peptide maturase [Micromonosporaceae bacterium]